MTHALTHSFKLDVYQSHIWVAANFFYKDQYFYFVANTSPSYFPLIHLIQIN